MRLRLLSSILVLGLSVGAPLSGRATQVEFIFTSDAHYGLTRPAFRGKHNVDAHIVNRAMVERINSLQQQTFPKDGGLRASEPIGPIDFLAEGGDIANREESGNDSVIQPAAVSWKQFAGDYVDGLTLTDGSGRRTPVFVVPGNHDATNAVGFYRPMTPTIDKTSMAEIYNRMMLPSVPRTSSNYDYATDKVLFARDIGGVHFVFLTVWPDSSGRAWMDRDLGHVSRSTPVVIFTHDQPDAEAKHFINPNGTHGIDADAQFENLLVDRYADDVTIAGKPSIVEQRALEAFVGRHSNISAYFHGNSNWNQFYDWTGPDHTIALHTFRVDSPMKGAVSAQDETRLSFQIATIDMMSRTMTVRECLWNADPVHPAAPMAWGGSTTVALSR